MSIPQDLIRSIFVAGYLKGFDEARYYILDQIRMTRSKFRDSRNICDVEQKNFQKNVLLLHYLKFLAVLKVEKTCVVSV